MRSGISIISLFFLLLLYSCEKQHIDTAQLTPLYSNPQAVFKDVSFPDPAHGFIVCSNGNVLKSVNGGQSFTTIDVDSASNKDYDLIFFKDVNNGLILDDEYYVFTSDGGLSWKEKDTSKTNPVKAAFKRQVPTANQFFLDAKQGYQFGIKDPRKTGIVKKTLDGGKTWKEVYSGQFNKVQDVDFFDSNSGFGVGDRSFIYTYTQGDSYIDLRDQNGNSMPLLLKCSVRSAKSVFAISEHSLYTIEVK